MRHITIQYGQPCNYLELTSDEFEMLEQFLRGVGVRCRTTTALVEDGERRCVIQADNPYRFWNDEKNRKIADEQMSDFAISCYKR